MKLKISKLLLESALIFQARNDVRYYLNGICFMPDGRIASTDGHRAFIGGTHDNKLTENVIIKIGKSPTKRYDYAIIDTKSKIATYHDEAGVMGALVSAKRLMVDSMILTARYQRKLKQQRKLALILAILWMPRKPRSCLILNSVALSLN